MLCFFCSFRVWFKINSISIIPMVLRINTRIERYFSSLHNVYSLFCHEMFFTRNRMLAFVNNRQSTFSYFLGRYWAFLVLHSKHVLWALNRIMIKWSKCFYRARAFDPFDYRNSRCYKVAFPRTLSLLDQIRVNWLSILPLFRSIVFKLLYFRYKYFLCVARWLNGWAILNFIIIVPIH